MARILLHYDIHDPDFRESLQGTITAENYNPRFQKVTESVYETNIHATPTSIDLLVRQLKSSFTDAPAGTYVVLERATTEDNAPTIISEVIAES